MKYQAITCFAAFAALSLPSFSEGFDKGYMNSSWYATSVDRSDDFGATIPYKIAQLGAGSCALRLQFNTVNANGEEWLLMRAPSAATCEDQNNTPMYIWIGPDDTGSTRYFHGGIAPPNQTKDDSNGAYSPSDGNKPMKLAQVVFTEVDGEEPTPFSAAVWSFKVKSPNEAELTIEILMPDVDDNSRFEKMAATIYDLKRFSGKAWGEYNYPAQNGETPPFSMELVSETNFEPDENADYYSIETPLLFGANGSGSVYSVEPSTSTGPTRAVIRRTRSRPITITPIGESDQTVAIPFLFTDDTGRDVFYPSLIEAAKKQRVSNGIGVPPNQQAAPPPGYQNSTSQQRQQRLAREIEAINQQ